MRAAGFIILVLIMTGIGCSTSSSSTAPAPSPSPSSPAGDDAGAQLDDAATSRGSDSAVAKHAEGLAIASCASSGSSSGAVIDASSLDTLSLVAHINRLPRPTDIACFVASLPRPLSIVATTSRASAQPAASAKSPRIFVMFPKIVVSLVPEGDASTYAETGEWMTPTRTIKGEIRFPFTNEGPITNDEPFLHIEQSTKTTQCGTCHRDEVAHPSIPHAYVSTAFRPIAAPVTLEALEAEHQACITTNDTTPRCLLFHAIFDFGPTTSGTFAREVATF